MTVKRCADHRQLGRAICDGIVSLKGIAHQLLVGAGRRGLTSARARRSRRDNRDRAARAPRRHGHERSAGLWRGRDQRRARSAPPCGSGRTRRSSAPPRCPAPRRLPPPPTDWCSHRTPRARLSERLPHRGSARFPLGCAPRHADRRIAPRGKRRPQPRPRAVVPSPRQAATPSPPPRGQGAPS